MTDPQQNDVNSSLADRMLRQSDAQAERLIAVLRMVLSAALFLGVGGLLLQLETAGLGIRQVELIYLLFGAACYFLLGATNYYISHPSRFRFWHSWLFNTLEIVLLGVQLFIDVRNPGTPSLVALASPLLLVAALVLAIQALRYRLELHVFTALALLSLCAAVTFYNPMLQTPWSNSVIEEMRVLYSPPPNVMRLIILCALAVVVGTAVFRARRLVLQVAREVEDAENLRRFLPAELRADLSDAALSDLRSPKTQDIAVLMVDLRGFTALTDRANVDDVAEVISWFRAAVLDAAERNSGVVDKFVGDGAVVIFGLNADLKTGIKDGFAAVEQLFAAIQRRDAGRKGHEAAMRVVMGLHAGPALVGAFGDDRRLEFTALGKTVNVASRLETLAKERDIRLTISRDTVEAGDLATDLFQDLGTVDVRGISAPISVMGMT